MVIPAAAQFHIRAIFCGINLPSQLKNWLQFFIEFPVFSSYYVFSAIYQLFSCSQSLLVVADAFPIAHLPALKNVKEFRHFRLDSFDITLESLEVDSHTFVRFLFHSYPSIRTRIRRMSICSINTLFRLSVTRMLSFIDVYWRTHRQAKTPIHAAATQSTWNSRCSVCVIFAQERHIRSVDSGWKYVRQ